jgi:hypothetical protein
VLAAVDGKLIKAWDFQEGAGWTWSSTDIVDLGPGRQGVALFSGVATTTDVDDRPDSLDLQIFGWSAAERRLVEETRRGRAFAAVVGRWATVEAAKKARDARKCAGRFSIRPLNELGDKKQRGFALVALTSFREAAERAVRQARTCLPRVAGAVVALGQAGSARK